MKVLRPEQLARSDAYAHFRTFAYPWFTLCSPVALDVTHVKAHGGLFGNVLWAVLAAVHEVPELRQRIRLEPDGTDLIVEHAMLDCTCTMARDDERFAFGYVPWTPSRADFLATLPQHIDRARARAGLDPTHQHRDDMLYLSSMPWVDISSVQHAMPGDVLDTVPRILWGRAHDGRMTVCLTAHHALVDGRHAAAFFTALHDQLARV